MSKIQNTPANLYGYDAICLMKESAINDQLATLFALLYYHDEPILTQWLHRSSKSQDDLPDDVTISFGPPRIKILETDFTKIEVFFPYKTGQIIFDMSDPEVILLNESSMKCVVDIKKTIIRYEDIIDTGNEDLKLKLNKNSTLLGDDILGQLRTYTENNPFDLEQFFITLNELTFGEDVTFDDSEPWRWTKDQFDKLENMTEKIFDDFRVHDITIPLGFASIKRETASTLEEKESFVPTNIRALSYSAGPTKNEDGLIYCMVGNKEGTLPPLQEFKMNLGEIEEGEQGTAMLKQSFFQERILDVIEKNAKREYNNDNIPEYNPFKHASEMRFHDDITPYTAILDCNDIEFSHETQDGRFKMLDRITNAQKTVLAFTFDWSNFSSGELLLHNIYNIEVSDNIRESANLYKNKFDESDYIAKITFSLKNNIIHGSLDASDTAVMIDPNCGSSPYVHKDYVYFQGGNNRDALYRRKADSSDDPVMIDPYCGSSPDVSTWGYVCFQGGINRNALYRRRIDSSDNAIQIDPNCGSSPYSPGNFLSFQGGNNRDALYRRTIDGLGDAEKIDDYCGSSPHISWDYVYFQGGNNRDALYRRTYDGLGDAEKIDDYCGSGPYAYSSYVYFQGGSNRDALYRCKKDGLGDAEKIDDYCGSSPYVSSNYVYWQGGSNRDALYRRKIDVSGTELEIDHHCGSSPYVHRDYVYWQGGSNRDALYRRRIDDLPTFDNPDPQFELFNNFKDYDQVRNFYEYSNDWYLFKICPAQYFMQDGSRSQSESDASPQFGIFTMFAEDKFWYKDLKFSTIEECQLVAMTITYKS